MGSHPAPAGRNCYVGVWPGVPRFSPTYRGRSESITWGFTLWRAMKERVEQPLSESDFRQPPPPQEGTRFENPTAAEGLPKFESGILPDNPGDDEATLSFAQERMWFFEQLEGSKPVNNISFRVEMGGSLDIDALEWAATELV